MRALLLLLLALVACTAPASPPSAVDGLAPGQRAPDFQVTSLDGQALASGQVSGGKPYILYFFATW